MTWTPNPPALYLPPVDVLHMEGGTQQTFVLPSAEATGTVTYSVQSPPTGVAFAAATRTVTVAATVAPGTYTLTYRATQGSDYVELSIDLMVIEPLVAIPTPTNVVFDKATDYEMGVSWDWAAGNLPDQDLPAVQFALQWKTSYDTEWTDLRLPVAEHRIAGLIGNAQYNVRVRAEDLAQGRASAWVASITAAPGPPQPSETFIAYTYRPNPEDPTQFSYPVTVLSHPSGDPTPDNFGIDILASIDEAVILSSQFNNRQAYWQMRYTTSIMVRIPQLENANLYIRTADTAPTTSNYTSHGTLAFNVNAPPTQFDATGTVAVAPDQYIWVYSLKGGFHDERSIFMDVKYFPTLIQPVHPVHVITDPYPFIVAFLLDTGEQSIHQAGSWGEYFQFTLTEGETLDLSLTDAEGHIPKFYLLSGSKTGSVLAESAPGTDANIAVLTQSVAAGTYVLECTTQSPDVTTDQMLLKVG